ncbi:MAG: NTP transferase domain-containing protein, partial [Candidatus Bathyarchaeota archaeon]
MKVTSVILAAGKSERMGKNKLLLEMKGKKLIEHILYAIESSVVNETIIVLGNKPWEIVDAVKSRLN